MSERYTLTDYDVYWDNGHYVAVRTGPDGVRRNIAPYKCRTKREAWAAAREDRDALNSPHADMEREIRTARTIMRGAAGTR